MLYNTHIYKYTYMYVTIFHKWQNISPARMATKPIGSALWGHGVSILVPLRHINPTTVNFLVVFGMIMIWISYEICISYVICMFFVFFFFFQFYSKLNFMNQQCLSHAIVRSLKICVSFWSDTQLQDCVTG